MAVFVPKFSTLGRFTRSFRLAPRSESVLVRVARRERIGDYRADVNSRTIAALVDVLALAGWEVYADLGRTASNQWWRLHYAGQKWTPIPHRFCRFDLLVTDDPSADRGRHGGLWRVRYGLAPEPAPGPHAFHLPYQVSPMLVRGGFAERGDAAPAGPRPIRVLFAGTADRVHYDYTDLIGRRFGKRTRWALLEQVRSRPDVVEPASRAELDALVASGGGPRIVVVDSERVKIPPSRWLELLSAAEFFFCPPGQIMPLCHNIVEAMSVGTIPITNYPEWLFPSLRDGGECLAFDDTPSLDLALDRALSMGDEAIALMRSAVRRYHVGHLDRRAVARRLAARRGEPLVLTITDETFHRVEALPPFSGGA